MSNLNEQIKIAFKDTQNSIISLLSHKTNAFLESYVSENYVKKTLEKDCLPISFNWWIGKNGNKNYAIHIDESIKPIDIAFSKELEKAGYKIIYITINTLTKEVDFVYNGQVYSLDKLIEELDLKNIQKPKTNNKNDNINNEVFEWCYQNLDYMSLLYDSAIEIVFLNKYMENLINLDVVWANEINNQLTFFVGEIKFKSKNKKNVFYMNKGEKYLYEKLTCETNIKIVLLALVSEKKERQYILKELMSNKKFPIFYCLLTPNHFNSLTTSKGKLSDFDKQNGRKEYDVFEFDFRDFTRVIDFNDIGQNDNGFIRALNKTLTKYSPFLNGNIGYCKKHIAKFYTLFKMMKDGFNVDYKDFISEDLINSNILTINNCKVLFKLVETVGSWNVSLSKSELDIAKEKEVDYILIYENNCPPKVSYLLPKQRNNGAKEYYIIDENTTFETIKIRGCIKFSTFMKYAHKFPANIPMSQKNRYAIRGLLNYEINMQDPQPKVNEDTYFLQLLGCCKSGFDKENPDCELIPYEKDKPLPFLSSYFIS